KDYFDFTTHEPYGVSAQIIPWNYPVEMTARSLSAALATGNSVVIKTPELTPLSNAWFAMAAEAVGLPAGAVNIICGLGHQAGAALASHRDVNQIVFTGSVPTGTSIATAAAQNVVPCVLELGGKSAAIVYDDADLEALESDVRWGIFFNAGQVCSAMSRLIVHEKVHDEMLERITHIAKELNVGPGIALDAFGANMGSMVSEEQRDRAADMISAVVSEGAKVAAGGRKMNIPGAFLEPTVLSDVSPEMVIANEEVFGPVLSVLKFKEDEEALAIANGTPYGLVGGVFTSNLDRATNAARKIRAGQIYVNEWYAGGVETPFGGYGKSGYGREKGREALWNYVQTKNVAIKLKG
ncbi:MAG: aldehyde dehydrogenase family protein, partial [Pseudomonadota bacterium]